MITICSEDHIRELYNFSRGDADVEFAVEQEDWTRGFYVAENTETGQLVGHIAAVKHGSMHAYIGGYYIHYSLHESGVGLRLLQLALEYVKGRNILADFQSAHFTIPIYETEILSQFKEANWHVCRYIGEPAWDRLPKISNQQLYVCHAQMIRVEDLSQFDRSISGQDRTEWLRRFLKHSNEGWIPQSAQLVVTDRRGDIRGYGCVRPSADRAKIGPIYARDLKVFLLLFRNLMGSSRAARTRGVDVAVFSANRQAVDIIESVLGLEKLQGDESKRYYNKWHPHVSLDQAYCLTNSHTQYI